MNKLRIKKFIIPIMIIQISEKFEEKLSTRFWNIWFCGKEIFCGKKIVEKFCGRISGKNVFSYVKSKVEIKCQ